MAQTVVAVDYDLTTSTIMRIIVPDDDAQLVHHKLNHGEGRVLMPIIHLAVDPVSGIAPDRSSLARAAEAVQRATGVRPPNAPQ